MQGTGGRSGKPEGTAVPIWQNLLLNLHFAKRGSVTKKYGLNV
ncbi:hypothetical protein AtDm6_0884 [Acetobacter tropicalis]|uniref:Uncharacterized protein n=1 Tax=Acetobacter tropicalis TaxID=104102 RepID=A0A095B8W3_9PROT|nr:hypothetical protein AtDm6_0884 [Acetobacter tropicalis]